MRVKPVSPPRASMDPIHQLQRVSQPSRRLSWLVLVVTLTVLAATLGLTTRQVRQGIRDQMARRDAEALHAVVVLLVDESDAEAGLAGPPTEPANQLLVVLEASRLRGVLGTRLFDAEGRFVEAFPPSVREAGLGRPDLAPLRRLQPVARFHGDVPAQDLFYPETTGPAPSGPIPVLEVDVPLHTSAGGRLLGVAQFILEGHSLAAEFDRLDRRLAGQAAVAFLVASAILVAAIGWALRRLGRANQLLAARSADLLRANEELALAARTTALGAVTSHLIHGLRNPLAGLRNFVAAAGPVAGAVVPDWEQAVASTQRMQSMIGQIVNVLREEETQVHYELTLAELADIIADRARPLADEAGVRFVLERRAEGVVTNRVANLVSLILGNLIQNAIQATPANRTVTLTLSANTSGVLFLVRDEGPGFPEAFRDNPFAPRRSAKEGGAGIGLAISRQLAGHLSATLELRESSERGCAFALNVPVAGAAPL
jgi:signal transduction histidine kinase